MAKTPRHWTDKWKRAGACEWGLELAQKYDTPQQWWRRTRQPDHMQWIMVRQGVLMPEKLRCTWLVGAKGAAMLRKYIPNFPKKVVVG